MTAVATQAWDRICNWSMRQRLACAGSNFSEVEDLDALCKWVIDDLNESLYGHETFTSWRPSPPQEYDADILSALVQNPNLSSKAAQMIVGSGWWRVRPAILLHPGVQITLLEVALGDLTGDGPFPVWRGASFSFAAERWYEAYTRNEAFDSDKVEVILTVAWPIPILMSLVAARDDLSDDHAALLAGHPSPAVRQRIVRNPSVSEHIRVVAALQD